MNKTDVILKISTFIAFANFGLFLGAKKYLYAAAMLLIGVTMAVTYF